MTQPNLTRPYRVLIAVTPTADLPAWVQLAHAITDMPATVGLGPAPHAEITLRGMVTIPAGVSLSEGVLEVRRFRDALDSALGPAATESTGRAVVDHQPLAAILNEAQTAPPDLLLIDWAGPEALSGGLSTDAILQNAPCDVALIGAGSWPTLGPVMLSLRGGPNLSLGVRVARALASDAPITLFHAADSPRNLPNFNRILAQHPYIARIVTAIGDYVPRLSAESVGQRTLVLGSGLRKQADSGAGLLDTLTAIGRETRLPLVVVQARTPEAVAFHAPNLIFRAEESLSTRVDRWFAENTFHSSEFADLTKLMALKERQGITISLALPALNEEATIGKVIQTVKTALMDEVPLLDEIVLIDSDSTDQTVPIAEQFGIPIYRHSQILTEKVGAYRGKGEALWKSLHVTKGDIVAWIDTDITNIHPRFVYGLLGPLLRRPDVQYVKGFYQRPIKVDGQLQASGGGRVTELVARPLLNLFYPELSGVVQPLSGEYAGRREALMSVPFFTGYGVETGLLIDLHDRYGLAGIAQVDLEERVHHNQSLTGLSRMSFAIHQVFISRLERRYSVQLLEKANTSMKFVIYEPDRFALKVEEIGDVERPPMQTIQSAG